MPQSDWLMLRGLWRKQALWLDPGCVGEQPFLWLWPSFMQGHGGEESERKKHRAAVGGASIRLWLIAAHASPEMIFSWPTWGAHRDNLTMFLPHFPPELNPIQSFSVAADYDVHSRLSTWLQSACNHSPALYCHSLDHSRADHSFFVCFCQYFIFFLERGLFHFVCCLISCWL